MQIKEYLEKESRKVISGIRRNAKKIIDDADPEAVHDYRVAIRKLRSIFQNSKNYFGSFYTKYFLNALGNMAKEASSLRDEEVLLEKLTVIEKELFASPSQIHPSDEKIDPEQSDISLENTQEQFKSRSISDWTALKQYFEEWKNSRQERESNLRENLKKKLSDSDFLFPLKQLEALFVIPLKTENPEFAENFAFSVTSKQKVKWANKIKTLEKNKKNIDWLHDLRIESKKMRYLIESYRPLLPPVYKETEKLARNMQKCLGDLNDNAFIRDKIEKDKSIQPDLKVYLLKYLKKDEKNILEKFLKKNLTRFSEI